MSADRRCKECGSAATYRCYRCGQLRCGTCFRLRKVPGMDAYRIVCFPRCRHRRRARCQARDRKGRRCTLPKHTGTRHQLGYRIPGGDWAFFHDGEILFPAPGASPAPNASRRST